MINFFISSGFALLPYEYLKVFWLKIGMIKRAIHLLNSLNSGVNILQVSNTQHSFSWNVVIIPETSPHATKVFLGQLLFE